MQSDVKQMNVNLNPGAVAKITRTINFKMAVQEDCMLILCYVWHADVLMEGRF